MKVNLSNVWSDQTEEIIEQVNIAIKNMDGFLNKGIINSVFEDMGKVCYFWTGKTYVGEKKDKEIEKVFQDFFKTFMEILLKAKSGELNCPDECKNILADLLYQGKIYRKLGSSNPTRKNEKIIPEYNDIYVSWSKNKENTYLDSKLYGTKTLITANIKNNYYGIDLEKFGCSAGEEREVVFPTIKECVTKIEYIDE